jgi:hypothetical protein
MVGSAAPQDKGKGSPPADDRRGVKTFMQAPAEVKYPESVSDAAAEGSREDGAEGATVTWAHQTFEVSRGQVLTFGRSSACRICLDPTDMGISRLAGSVEYESGSWWLRNRSTTRALVAVDEIGLRTVVAPGRRMAVDGRLTVMVEGSNRRHALEVLVGPRDEHPGLPPTGPPVGELPTAAPGQELVNSLDRLALVALFSGYLEPFPRYNPHPKSYADAAAVLGWPRTTLTKRIEHLRAKLTAAGVPNLVGDDALDHLAEWSLTTRLLSRDDLALIGR